MTTPPEPPNPFDSLAALHTLIRAAETADVNLRMPQRLRIHAERLRITATMLEKAAFQHERMDELWQKTADECIALRKRVKELEAEIDLLRESGGEAVTGAPGNRIPTKAADYQL